MGKNQSASNLTNIIQYNNGNISFVSGSTTLMQISSSGAITITGVISGSTTLSSSFATTASYAVSATSASYSLNSTSASYALNATSASNSTLLANRDVAQFATTASNVYYGNQIVSASVLVSGSITATGQIVAQTINVQSVTSSIVYSSGSNVFGNRISDTQTFTGSMLISGSVNAVGAICTVGTVCAGSVCAPSHIGGTFSGTVIYGSSAICGGVISGSGALLTGALSGTSATFSGNIDLNGGELNINYDKAIRWKNSGGTLRQILAYADDLYIDSRDGGINFRTGTGGSATTKLTISSTGAATFSSTLETGGDITVSKSGDSGININSTTTNGVAVTRYKTTAAGNLWATGINITAGDSRWEVYNFTSGASPFRLSNSTGAATFSSNVNDHSIRVQNSNTSGYSSIDLIDSAGTEKLILGWGNSGLSSLASKAFLYTTSGVDLNFYTGGSTTAKMIIQSGGNVGIGATTVNSRFHIFQTGQPDISCALYATQILQTDSQANYQRIRFDRDSCPFWGVGVEGASSTNDFIISGLIGGKTSGTWSDNVFRIKNSNGYVGIGTASPNYQLQINSSTSISRIQLTNTSTGTASGDGFQVIADGVNSTLSLPETGYMSFETSNTERMRIKSSGVTSIGRDPFSFETYLSTGYSSALQISNGILKTRADNDGNHVLWVGSCNTTAPVGVVVGFRSHTTTAACRFPYFIGTEIGASPSHIAFNPDGGNPSNILIHTYQSEGVGWTFVGPSPGYAVTKRSGTAGQAHISFQNGNGQVGYIATDGTTTSYVTTSSDLRMKKNFESWDENISILFSSILPKKFNYCVECDDIQKTKGFIAQCMIDKFPEAYPADQCGNYSFNPSGMVVYLMKAIQELKCENDIFKTCLGIA